MLKNLTIRTRTALGFGLILLVMATVVTFSIRGLQSSSSSFQTYRRLARSSVLSGRVQANMLMASKAAKNFLRSRDDRQLEVYNERLENARKFALEEQATLVDPQRCELSERLVSQLDGYQQANQEVIQLMRGRDAILQETLNPQGLKMRENLSKIMVSAYRDEDPEAAYLSGRALERVLLGRLYMFKFLEDNREADAERVRSELGSGFRQDFDQMAFAIDDPVRKDLLQEFSTARDAYLAAFEELVLGIQKRNTLIAQEMERLDQSIADVSEQIKLSLKADQDKLGPSVQASNTATIGRVQVGSIVAVVLSMLIAWFFVRTIATSIAALGQSEAETERLSCEITLREETERKLASALSEVERVNFLSDIALEQTHCGYWHVDYSDPDYYYQSERAATILGEPIKPDGRYHLQREWFDRLLEANPGTAEETSERYQGAIDGRYENYESTYPYKRPVDGEVVWVHALGKIVRDDAGKIRHMYGVYQDVTRQKQAEQAVIAAEQRSRSLLESAPDGMMIADDQGRIIIVNAQFESLFGYTKDEIVGQFVEVLLPDRFREEHVDQRTSFFGTPSVRNMGSGMEMFALRKDSTEFPVEISLSPLQTDEGMLVSSSIRDISQRKRSEEAMRKSEEQFRTLVGNIPGVVYRCLPRHPWTMLFISDGIEVLSGYAASDFLGEDPVRTFGDIMHPDDVERTARCTAEAVAERRPYVNEYRAIDATGEVHWVYARGRAVYDVDGEPEYLDGTIFDISDRKKAEKALRNAKERLTHELAVARELADVADREHQLWLQGESIAVRALREGIEAHAGSDKPVLLTGPNGSGQEAVARAIHRYSPRSGRPFIYVACPHVATVDDTIFGFRSTDSDQPSPGKMLLADGGTLYLEGIEALGRSAQENLVESLRDASAQRTAGQNPTPDVRLIAYASCDLSNAVQQGDFDGELANLLGVRRLAVPSLAERRDDVISLAGSIVEKRARTLGKTLDGISTESAEMLLGYSWPGNLGELQSVVERAVVLATGTSVDIPADLLREGRRVGGYTLERQLGSGAMGEVWLARHALLARPSAIKLIRQEALQGKSSARKMLEQRFQREAQTTSQLRSPHTVELYDFGVTEDGDFYYVMEYLNGVDLDSLVAEHGPVDPARAVFLLRQACMSLGEAHQAGLVHRDVKPANLFTCRLGPHYDFLKLLDFGIVRATIGPDQTVTMAGQIKGTPTSLSPEVAQGEHASFVSDIYGLGCVAYWLLSGQHVFEAPTLMALLMKHVTQPITPPSEFMSDLPNELNELVMSCLAKNPADRPNSAFELAERLAAVPFDDPWGNHHAEGWWNANMPAENGNAPTDILSETIDVSSSDTG